MSKTKILTAIKKHQVPFVPLPQVPDFPQEEVDVCQKFIEIAAKSGTTCYSNNEGINWIIKNHFLNAKNIVAPSLAGIGNMEVDSKTSVEVLRKIDLTILEASIGVAENGALWLSEKNCPHRVLPFITQHLILLIDNHNIVSNMHQAYRKISITANGFGVFIAGPSKTADIEQSLVIGAQGARSLNVFLNNFNH